jgi:flagellar hook-associated protein 1 FlgK
MGSTFSGLNTALTSLYAQRRGLDVTGQNVANANTQGYSRQRVNMQAVGGPAIPAMHSTYSGGGNGVTVSEVQRLRDGFLETRAQVEHGQYAQLAGERDLLVAVEDLFGEPSDTGMSAQLSDLWSAWHDVANQPSEPAARSQLLQRAGTLTDTVRNTYDGMSARWSSSRESLEAVASEVTTTAATVAQLNEAIRRNNQAGITTNELADQRDGLVMKLSQLVGATSRPGEDGVVDVYVGGTALVRGATSEGLQVVGTTSLASATTDPVRLEWVGGGYAAGVTTGTAAAHIDALGSTLPRYADQLDGFAKSLAESVNAVHSTAYAPDGTQPGNFFSGTTASTLRVAITTPSSVAVSAYPGDTSDPAKAGTRDGSLADTIAKLATKAGGPDAVYRDVIVNLAVVSQTANRRADIQSDVTLQVDAARESQAGVDMDEEMVNMIAFQRAYEGASRVISSIDSVLDTLINRTGLVGR